MEKSRQLIQYAQASKEIPLRVHGCLEEELKYPVFTKSTAAKRRSKLLAQPSETLLYNSGLYILFINKQISKKEGLYSRALITGRTYMFQIWWAYIRVGL